MKEKVLQTVVVTFEEFTAIDFLPPGTFYVRDALGNYVFLKTSDRLKAQKQIDTTYGKGKYTVMAAKILPTKSKLESGGYSCTGTSTRRGQKR